MSDGNSYSDSLLRILKYTSAYPSKPFESLAAARECVQTFVQSYHAGHRHSDIRLVTPAERHEGHEQRISTNRQALYAEAKRQHPARWSGPIRNWTPNGAAWLNPADRKDLAEKRGVKNAITIVTSTETAAEETEDDLEMITISVSIIIFLYPGNLRI